MHDFPEWRMKSPVYKINSVTTSATSINKVANFDCIAQVINHPALKKKEKKKVGGEGSHFSISWAFPSFLIFCSVPQNIAFSQSVYDYVFKRNLHNTKNLCRKIKTCAGPTSDRCRSSAFSNQSSSVVALVLTETFSLTLHKHITLFGYTDYLLQVTFKY